MIAARKPLCFAQRRISANCMGRCSLRVVNALCAHPDGSEKLRVVDAAILSMLSLRASERAQECCSWVCAEGGRQTAEERPVGRSVALSGPFGPCADQNRSI